MSKSDQKNCMDETPPFRKKKMMDGTAQSVSKLNKISNRDTYLLHMKVAGVSMVSNGVSVLRSRSEEMASANNGGASNKVKPISTSNKMPNNWSTLINSGESTVETTTGNNMPMVNARAARTTHNMGVLRSNERNSAMITDNIVLSHLRSIRQIAFLYGEIRIISPSQVEFLPFRNTERLAVCRYGCPG